MKGKKKRKKQVNKEKEGKRTKTLVLNFRIKWMSALGYFRLLLLHESLCSCVPCTQLRALCPCIVMYWVISSCT
jgi:hypothetical protein